MRQSITLTSDRHYGRRLPPEAFGEVLRTVQPLVRQSIRMRFEGRSRAAGRRPAWLSAASDIRFVGHEGGDSTILHFEVPTLGEAAASLYEQQAIWDTRPDAADTGFDLLGDVIGDVAASNADSDRYDKQLLHTLSHFRKGLNGSFRQMAITGRRYRADAPAILDHKVLSTAVRLTRATPRAQQARVMGRLDMIRASTQAFALQLADGQEVRGVLVEGDIGRLTELFRKDVLVIGKAVYRPSGRLLRIDAGEVMEAAATDRFFSRPPTPVGRRFDAREFRQQQQRKRGLAAIIGRWPGDETDDEIAEALRELS